MFVLPNRNEDEKCIDPADNPYECRKYKCSNQISRNHKG